MNYPPSGYHLAQVRAANRGRIGMAGLGAQQATVGCGIGYDPRIQLAAPAAGETDWTPAVVVVGLIAAYWILGGPR